MLNLLDTLKQNNEDFEFYPTTRKMFKTIYGDINYWDEYPRLLEIGSGRCDLYKYFQEFKENTKRVDSYGDITYTGYNLREYFIIEKSKILLEQAPNDAIIVGTDFNKCSLIDKNVDIIFCNPPYTQFEEWTIKILEENYSKYVYIIIPSRWRDSQKIQQVINDRHIQYNILETTDFLNAERQARAKVDIIRFRLKSSHRYREEPQDPFEYWFKNEFKVNGDEDSYSAEIRRRERESKEKAEKIQNGVALGLNLSEVLVGLYNVDMQRLLNNYRAIASLDYDILKELNVDISKLMEGLKLKVESKKREYWRELFDRLDKITNRLTSKSRQEILETLNGNTNIDFNEENIFNVVLWTMKNANKYFDEQLKTMFITLTEPENIKNYKSNQKTWKKEGWRYNVDKKEMSHYILDYRIIVHSYEYKTLVNDLITIANNLGFKTEQRVETNIYKSIYDYSSNQQKQDFGQIYFTKKGKNNEDEDDLLLYYKAYKNYNLHLRISKKFMKAFNIEASRLFGWVKNKEDVLNEFPESNDKEYRFTGDDVDKYFKINLKIESNVNSVLMIEN